MNILNRVLFLVIFLLLSGNGFACEKIWKDFLASPRDAQRNALSNELGKHNTDCKPTSKQVNTLIRLMGDQSDNAIEIAFQVVHLTSGGNAGDLIRRIGVLSEINPETFLSLVKKHNTDEFLLHKYLTNLPLYTTDDIEAMIRLTIKRIEKLNTISQSELIELKELSLEILQENLDSLKKIKSRISK